MTPERPRIVCICGEEKIPRFNGGEPSPLFVEPCEVCAGILRQHITSLEAWIRKHGRHSVDCYGATVWYNTPCACGLDDLMDGKRILDADGRVVS